MNSNNLLRAYRLFAIVAVLLWFAVDARAADQVFVTASGSGGAVATPIPNRSDYRGGHQHRWLPGRKQHGNGV
jgi:hypothetical protein